jgi:NAD(P)-dependent dehydrogenase (short-subunit alcohol dehydrogenase family)
MALVVTGGTGGIGRAVARSVVYWLESGLTHGEVHSVNGGMHFR